MGYGSFINVNKSNWWVLKVYPDGTTKRAFRYQNLVCLAGQVLPNIGSMITIVLSFKYAALGGINQGIIVTLSSLSTVYSAVLFYYVFHETVSPTQFLGMAIMVACVILLAFEGQSNNTLESNSHINTGPLS